jgi:electron transport complex protein RnfB
MIAAISTLTLLGFGLGMALGVAAKYLRVETNPIVEEIEAMLPGSQCGQCGFPGCTPAAEAVANGDAPVTMCPPGGKSVAQQIAEKLGVEVDLSAVDEPEVLIAYVKEEICVGCTRCYKVCPTDAIVGGPKQIHTVFADACTGCKSCVDICPTESMQIRTPDETIYTWHWPMPEKTVEPAKAA